MRYFACSVIYIQYTAKTSIATHAIVNAQQFFSIIMARGYYAQRFYLQFSYLKYVCITLTISLSQCQDITL